jgi:hypothetical protein
MALLSRSRARSAAHARDWLAAVRVLAALGGAAAVGIAEPPPARAQRGEMPEYRVKAAYLVNFARYVEWPAQSFATPETPIRLCVVGDDPFRGDLERAARGRTAHGRPIEVRHVDRASDARSCHLVFVGYAEWRRRPDLLGALQERGVVTVGEGAAFAEAGGVLSFMPVQRTVRFAVNLAAQDDAGVRISSRMLALAARVVGRDGGEGE